MKINKLKTILIAICCVAASLFSETQGVQDNRENHGHVRNNQKGIPAGSVVAFSGEIAPDGWLLCDGEQYSNQRYPELYEVVREKYVLGGSWVIEANRRSQLEKYFCVPDLRGRVIIGVDGGTGRVTANNTIGESGGTENVILTINQMPRHSHGKTFEFDRNGAGQSTGWPEGPFSDKEFQGGDQPHNNMQPYTCLNYIINTGQANGQQNEIFQLKQKINQLEISQKGCAKAWVVFDGSATILDSYGVSSVVRNSVGNYTINFLTPFSSSDYCSSLSPTTADCAVLACTSSQTQQSFIFNTFRILGWLSADPVRVSACFFGNQ